MFRFPNPKNLLYSVEEDTTDTWYSNSLHFSSLLHYEHLLNH